MEYPEEIRPELIAELERVNNELDRMNIGEAKDLIKKLMWKYRENYGLEGSA